jgi:PleD family two-component response regulator
MLLDSNGNIVGAIESIRDITRHKQAEEKLRHLSNLDGLTGIPNRRSFEEYLERKWNCAVRNKKPLSLIICDIDYFKAYNDSYGRAMLCPISEYLFCLAKRVFEIQHK